MAAKRLVVDAHTHAFPDQLASRAIAHLERRADIRAALDGTAAALVASMDRAGIARSIVCSVATGTAQFEPILHWCAAIASPRLIPFPSVHPAARDQAGEVRRVAAAGFRGVKLHPEYQDFHVDDDALEPLYSALEECGLVALLHAGHDIGFPDSDRAAPARFLSVHRAFPRLALVASHLGGFRRWDEVAAQLVGSGIWLDTSYTIGRIPEGLLRQILLGHRPDRLLFGSDSPWEDQASALAALRDLGLPPDLEDRILGRNALDLLGISPQPG